MVFVRLPKGDFVSTVGCQSSPRIGGEVGGVGGDITIVGIGGVIVKDLKRGQPPEFERATSCPR